IGTVTTRGSQKKDPSASPRVGMTKRRAHRSMSSEQSLTRRAANDTPFPHDKPASEQRQVWSLAGRARRRALGHGKRLAHPAKQSVRRRGNRFLGTRVDSPHLFASPPEATSRDPEDRRAYLGLFDPLW